MTLPPDSGRVVVELRRYDPFNPLTIVVTVLAAFMPVIAARWLWPASVAILAVVLGIRAYASRTVLRAPESGS